jgi:hypothetical protein
MEKIILEDRNGNGAARSAKRGNAAKRLFPTCTLQAALAVPKALKEFNGGNPWTPGEVGRALERSAKTVDFYYLTAASRDYGLTSGTRDSKSISIADGGRDYLFAESPAAEKAALQKAFMSVPLFKAVFDYYQGGKLPEMKYLKNNLEGRFEIEPRFHDDFYRIFKENCALIDLVGTGNGTPIAASPAQGARAGATIEVGAPAGTGAEKAFVIMPFSEKTDVYPEGFYTEVLTNLITPSAVAAGFSVYTARKEGSDLIHATIINELIEAPLVLCDLTEHNPNVLLELGFRLAKDKPIVLIRAKGTAPVFDVDNLLRVWEYNPNLWKSTLETDIPALTKHLKGAWDNRSSAHTYLKILTGKAA